jgi:hypothetical protein
VSGWPRLRLRDANGHGLHVSQRNVGSKPTFQSAVKLTTSVAGHYKYGIAQVTWLNWCKGKMPRPLKMVVRLPAAAARTVPINPGGNVIASCVNPTASSELQLGRLEQAHT